MIVKTPRAFLLAFLLAPSPALAQARECRIPQIIPRPRLELPSQREPRRVLPIGGFTLALSWSPEYCRARTASARDAVQCGGADDHFGFTLHGLWPEGKGREWPQYCRAVGLLPEKLIRKHLCATPSPQLLQHEWAKHGACTRATPDAYFLAATLMYSAVRYPDMKRLSRRRLTVSEFAQAFARVNPGMDASMLRIGTNRRAWLDEVLICLRSDLKLRRCPPHQPGAPASARLRIYRGGDNGL